MNDNATIIGHIIDGDAWLPVTFDGTAYTVDLGGAQGTSDPTNIDGDARDALESIAAELSDEYGHHVGYVMRDRYEVCVIDGRENVGDVFLSERFDDLDVAMARFDELRDGYDFDDSDELWVFEDMGDGYTTSIDGYTAADRS